MAEWKKKKCSHYWAMWKLSQWTCVKCGAKQKANPYKEEK